MLKIRKKFNYIELLKWVVLPSFILTFLGNLGRSQVPTGLPNPSSNIHASDFNEDASKKIADADLSSFSKVFDFFELEEDNVDDKNSESEKSLQSHCFLILDESTSF